MSIIFKCVSVKMFSLVEKKNIDYKCVKHEKLTVDTMSSVP